MKKFLFSILTIAALGLAACGDHHEHGDASSVGAKAHGASKEYTAAYVCPMHCEGSGGDQPGTCPKCGMDYVMQAEHVKDGHVH